jgi:uncharacterized protein YPO0396
LKQLTRIRLVNWHLFENATITCNGTTYFIGVNGAGKSTILDALQFALVGGQRDVRFNRAALAESKRSLASYVRGELGTEGQRYLRGDATGVVALEFRNPDESHFVHGAVIDAYEDGRSPDIVYFIVHNAPLDDEWFFHKEAAPSARSGEAAPGRLFDSRAFKRHLEHFAFPRGARGQVFPRVEDYRLHLLNRLGQLKDSFPAKIVKGLAFTPLTDIRRFVLDYLLDENLIDVKTLQAQLETLRHFESLAADVRERIETLTRIETLDGERLANRRRRVTNGYIARRAQSDTHLAGLKAVRLQLDETRLTLNRAVFQRDELGQRLRRAQAAFVDAQVALQTDLTAVREQELRDQIAGFDSEVKDLKERKSRLDAALSAEAKDSEALSAMLAADDRPVPASLSDFTQTVALDSSRPLGVQSLIADLESLGHAYSSQCALLDDQASRLRGEAGQIEGEIDRLQSGDYETSYESLAPEAVRLRRLLMTELGLAAHDCLFLCSALRVSDESWQDAVEGVLGSCRFSLLVPPQRYAAAVRLYRERRGAEHLHGVGLLDAERILAHAHPAPRGSLAAEVQTDHPAARALVNLVLGGYVKCDSLAALRDHRTAVTRECFVRRNFVTSHLNPGYYRHWFIGDRAVPRRVELLQGRLGEVAGDLAAMQPAMESVRQRLALTRDKVRPLVEVAHNLQYLERLPGVEHQLRSLRSELGHLERGSTESLRARIEACRAEAERLQSEAAQLDQSIGGWRQQAESLETETVPGLERAIAEHAHNAEQFLLDQASDELREEIGREYERRRERQPLETVLANAVRYEGDHAGAEARSRDRLREAKQAYSLTYDFGYDDDEDAARYVAERDKFMQSELPQYEARIAEQRALAEQELVENFIHRLREQIEDARQQLDYLNGTLRELRFGGERYEFITRPAPSLRQVYDMIMDSQQVLGDSLFETDYRQKHQQGWDLLFERLTADGADEAAAELAELQDYRNYLEYDIRIHYPNADRALLSQINAKKSGGETTTPFYVAMAASFAQAYRLNQTRPADTIRLALFDEAFSKMDTARTASALQFMRDTGLQVLLATPPDKSGALLSHVDSVRTVVRKNSHAFVIEIDKAEMLRELG